MTLSSWVSPLRLRRLTSSTIDVFDKAGELLLVADVVAREGDEVLHQVVGTEKGPFHAAGLDATLDLAVQLADDEGIRVRPEGRDVDNAPDPGLPGGGDQGFLVGDLLR